MSHLDTGTLAWMVGSGLGTAVGGLLLLLVRRPSGRALDVMLGFTAGVMLGATAFGLLVPALDAGGAGEVLAGFGLGAGLLALLDVIVPHAHARFAEREHEPIEQQAQHRAVLLLSALTIHNVPEGMAVGLAFAAGGDELGVTLALAIGIQNVPEGFAAAAPLRTAGTGLLAAVGIAALTGVVEPIAAVAAFGAAEAADALLSGGLGFAAGAMLYVVVDELIPESHAGGSERAPTLALLAGFMLMVGPDTTLG